MFRANDVFYPSLQSLLAMHDKASEHNDAHLTDFLEGEFLDEQVRIVVFIHLMYQIYSEVLSEFVFD